MKKEGKDELEGKEVQTSQSTERVIRRDISKGGR